MRSLNSMLCRFYAHPGAERGNASQLANRAADCVITCKTRLIVVDDVHFLDLSRRDGREVANHFKWLANQFPVTFLFVGVGLHQRRLLDEGLTASDRQFAQTARRWTRLTLSPFEVETEDGRRTWRGCCWPSSEIWSWPTTARVIWPTNWPTTSTVRSHRATSRRS